MARFGRGTGRILRTVSFGLLLGAAGARSFAETSLTLFSEPGDPVGRGKEYAFAEADGTFTVTRNAWNGVSVWMRAEHSDWTLDFAGISRHLLTVRTYTDVIHYPPLDPARPSLQISGYAGCSIVAGRFEVIDVAYGAGGGIDRFRARFEQYCQSSTHPLTGEIRFQTIVPIDLTAPTTESVLEGSELRFTVSGVPDDGGPVALSAEGLPAGASFTSTAPRSGELRWTPGAQQAGSYIVTFFGEDSSGHIENTSTRILVGDVLHVPSDHATIQAAIDVATERSLVIVGPGTYRENLDMHGKALTLRSEEGPLATIIDGQRHGSVILVDAPGPGAGVEGFTIQNGASNDGAGLWLGGGSPRVVGNIFLGNEHWAGGEGAAIGAYGGTPFIDRNVFRDNRCDGQWSAGVISLGGDASSLVANNLFEHNPCAAINLRVSGASAASIVNNTMFENRVGVRLEGQLISASHIFGNNVIVGNEIGLQVDNETPGRAPIWTHNLLSGNDVDYLDTSDRTGVDGNIDAPPSFLCPARSDYRPTASSPVVDTGDDTIVALPALDLRGTPRTLDGDGDGTAVVDLGALEYDPSSPGICLVCPADMTLLAPHGQVTAVVDYPPPALSEGSTVQCNPPSGAALGEGMTTVTCVAHDATLDTETCSFRITVIVPPPNDDFDFATEIPTLPFLDRVDTRKATDAADDPSCGRNGSVWYTYLPLQDTLIDFQTSGSSYLTVLSAYTGERGSLVVATDSCVTGHMSVAARAGQRIYIKVTSHHSPNGGDLLVSVTGVSCTSRPLDCGPPRLVRPNWHGVLASGSITDIVWEAPATAVSFDLRYTIDGGASWKPIASGLTGKSFAWTVPVTSANKPQSKVRVVAYNTAGSKAGADESDLPFTIQVVKLDEPDGHEDLYSGTTTLIQWTTHATMSTVAGAKVQFTTNGGSSWKTVASLSGNPGEYAWVVPAIQRASRHCKVRIVLEDADGRSLGKDTSDAAFTIYPGAGRS